MDGTTSRYLPARGYYRSVPTKTLLDEYECWQWNLAEYAPGDPNHEYIRYRINAIADEVNRRQQLRDVPGAPKWPTTVPDRRQNLRAIKDHFPLLQFVQTYTPVQFTQRGDEFVAQCPFLDHDDSSPSFTVNPQKDVFHCFGCQRGGDLFEFARHFFGIAEFADVADVLAGWAGLPRLLPNSQSPRVRSTGSSPIPHAEMRGGRIVRQ